MRFLKNKGAKWSIRTLLLLFVIAILGDFFAGNIPIYCKINGQSYFPVLKKYAVDVGVTKWDAPFQNVDWKTLDYEHVIYPLIPYSASAMDAKNRSFKSPFDKQDIASDKFKHWLGTDGLGRDVTAAMFNGLRVALKVGILSMLLASIIGLTLGGLAGYFGDDGLEISIGRIILNSVAFLLSIHFAFIARSYALTEGSLIVELGKSIGIVLLLFVCFNFFATWLERLPFLSKLITVPIDMIVMRMVEVMSSIPGLLLILAVVMIVPTPSIFTIILIIGVLRWPNITRFVRAELLKVRNLEYIQAAKAMGFSHGRTLFRHALPNALGPVLITIAFGIASAILTEATLSFLGIGIGTEVTWGSLLRLARQQRAAWWLAVFPGLAIFVLVLIFNLIGEGLKEAIDARE